MSTDLVKQNNALASLSDLKPAELQLVKDTIGKNLSDDELRWLLYQAKQLGLNPLLKQVYAVKRYDSKLGREVMSVQIGIDGARGISETTDEYEGQTAPMWCGKDGQWTDVWLAKEPPLAAKVGVFRKGFREAVFGIAKYDSYVQVTKNGIAPLWTKMPDIMLAKCAESLALRKAFPKKLNGIYTNEEMQQAENKDIQVIEEPHYEQIVEPVEIPFAKITENCENITDLTELTKYYHSLDAVIKANLDIIAIFGNRKKAITALLSPDNTQTHTQIPTEAQNEQGGANPQAQDEMLVPSQIEFWQCKLAQITVKKHLSNFVQKHKAELDTFDLDFQAKVYTMIEDRKKQI